MDLSDIGKCCQYPYCGIRDFLPFYCNSCQKYYCLQHKDYAKHECVNNPELQDLDKSKNVVASKKKKSERYQCKVNDCKKCNQVPIKCMKCQLNFCLKHRYQESHDCISLQKPPVKSKTQRVVSKPPQVKKNPRNSLFHFPKFTVF